MIFGRLVRRVASRGEETDEVLAAFTGSPGAILQQVIDWLDEQSATGRDEAALLFKADERLAGVCADIEEDIVRQRRLGTGQKQLRAYCEHFGQAYARHARRLPMGDPGQFATRLRAIHLLGRASRLARVFHDDRADLRRECLALFTEGFKAGIGTTRKPAYPGRPDTSMAQELAITLLWETVPFDTLTLEQDEYLERLMNACGQQIVLKTTVGAMAPHAVLPDGRVVGPARVGAETPILFVGPGPLVAQLAGVIKLPDTADFPAWAGEPLPETDLLALKSLARRVTLAWERKTVQRAGERQPRGDAVCVTGGFGNIRRAVAYAAYVRSGGHLDVYATRSPIISERVREVMVGLEKERRDMTSLEILQAMERMGDSQAVETWFTHDSSARGYNLAVPAYRGWLSVEGLIAVRETDSIDWRIGIVRRLYGPADGRHAGIELLPGLPVAVGIGNEGKTENVSIADLRDALLVVDEEAIHLVTPFECVPKGTYLLMGQGRRLCRIGELAHGNAEIKAYTCLLSTPEKD